MIAETDKRPQRTLHGTRAADDSVLRRDHALRAQNTARRWAKDSARPGESRRSSRTHRLPARAVGLRQDHDGQPRHGHPGSHRRHRAGAGRAGALPHGTPTHRLHAAGHGAVRGRDRRGEPALLRHAQRLARARAGRCHRRHAGLHAARLRSKQAGGSVLGRHEATSVAGRGHAAPPRPARAGQAYGRPRSRAPPEASRCS